ncbi:hypothetical protein ACFV30_35470 [Streptomyces sp. NPDC059752]|uniref:hypothetical protein n=1 Tax=unclassified Streptomyces TaxID=2593676 RepID=UPI0036503A89
MAVYALGARKLAGSPVSAAMVFADCGVLIGPVVVEDAAVHNAIAVQLKDGFLLRGAAALGERLVGMGETEVVADEAVPGAELFGLAGVAAPPQGFELIDEAVHDAEPSRRLGGQLRSEGATRGCSS